MEHNLIFALILFAKKKSLAERRVEERTKKIVCVKKPLRKLQEIVFVVDDRRR